MNVKYNVPEKEIRASFNDETIRVYQAYNHQIADSALEAGTFVSPPFKLERMTWIKPSFLWTMYRSGWGLKDKDQARILAIDISHEGFRWALEHSCQSHKDPSMSAEEWSELKATNPVRIQWDPERNILLEPLPYRAIQIGIGGSAVSRYINEWIKNITDMTSLTQSIYQHLNDCDYARASELLPTERPYCLNSSQAI